MVELLDFDVIAEERYLLVEKNARKTEIASELEMTTLLEEMGWK